MLPDDASHPTLFLVPGSLFLFPEDPQCLTASD
jgi:hypothetical protein